MPVPPNLVVGALGSVVFLATGYFIVSDWNALTGQSDYDVSVRTHSQRFGQVDGTVPNGGTRTETFRIDHENVYRSELRLTWRENELAQHDVTLLLYNAAGSLLAQETGRGGVAGITIDRTMFAVPEPERFRSTADGAEAAFEARYPGHPETRGTWQVVVRTNAPTSPAASSVQYTVSFTVHYYTLQYSQVSLSK